MTNRAVCTAVTGGHPGEAALYIYIFEIFWENQSNHSKIVTSTGELYFMSMIFNHIAYLAMLYLAFTVASTSANRMQLNLNVPNF